MRLSVSNLSWGDAPVGPMAAALAAVGVDGLELAPTALWPSAPAVSGGQVRRLRSIMDDTQIRISGLQSLLYGHPQMQLLDPRTWPAMHAHLREVLDLGGRLGAQVAVFGSPKNRLRGSLSTEQADELAADFFSGLLPALTDAGMVLALEPNAPAYGADYLTTYQDVLRLRDLIGSPLVVAQVDTGCLRLVGEDPVTAVRRATPGHVHISVAQLRPVPGEEDFSGLAPALRDVHYQGWVVLEMLAGDPTVDTAMRSAQWLVDTFGGSR